MRDHYDFSSGEVGKYANRKVADVCDFCDRPNVVRRYQCMDFDAESADAGVLYGGPTNVVLHSTSYWAACAECGRYVDAEDLDGLLKHASAVLGAQGNIPFLIHARHAYALFFKNRIRVKI